MSTVCTEYVPVGTVIDVLPVALTCALLPIHACVSLLTTGTETAAPTAALPPPLMFPATTFSVMLSSAVTPTLPVVVIDAPCPLEPSATNASVVMLTTGTAACTLTEAVPPKPPPTESSVNVSCDLAVTVALPEMVIEPLLPIEASVSLLKTSTTTPTPTPAVPPIPIVPASERSLVSSSADTETPVPPIV